MLFFRNALFRLRRFLHLLGCLTMTDKRCPVHQWLYQVGIEPRGLHDAAASAEGLANAGSQPAFVLCGMMLREGHRLVLPGAYWRNSMVPPPVPLRAQEAMAAVWEPSQERLIQTLPLQIRPCYLGDPALSYSLVRSLTRYTNTTNAHSLQ